jgi:hypothetical protein
MPAVRKAEEIRRLFEELKEAKTPGQSREIAEKVEKLTKELVEETLAPVVLRRLEIRPCASCALPLAPGSCATSWSDLSATEQFLPAGAGLAAGDPPRQNPGYRQGNCL